MLKKRGDLDYSYREFAQRDEPALIALVKSNFPSFLKGDYWVWKYKLNPDFDPSLVVVAEKNGKVVGCDHWLVRDLKLSSSLKVRATLGADLTVHPEHRRRGIGTQLLQFFRLSGVFKEKGIVLAYVFADPKFNKSLYGPVAGYVVAPNSTTTYKKVLNCRELKEKVHWMNDLVKSKKELQKKLEGLRLCVLFRLRGYPVFTIHIESGGVYLEEGEAENPDVVVEGSLPLSSLMMETNNGIWGLAKAWVMGKIKIRKGLLTASKALKALKVFQLVFGEK